MHTHRADQPAEPRPRAPRPPSTARRTVTVCLRHRITGLAAEAAFWVLLSIPPLALGVVALLGYLHGRLGADRTAELERFLDACAGTVLSPREVRQTVGPAIGSMLGSGHADIASGGFLVALWSGSRALNVAVDTITVASGQSGRRGWVRTRLLAFALYLPALLLGALSLPLLLAGTELLARLAPPSAAPVLTALAWPVLAAALVLFLTTLYHLALPDRTRWRAGLPGALVALGVWAAGSALLREYVHGSAYSASSGLASSGLASSGLASSGLASSGLASSGLAHSGLATSGPDAGLGRLAATAAILLWLYVTALAVLIGAVFNAVRAGTPPPAPGGAAQAARDEPAGNARGPLRLAAAQLGGPGADLSVPAPESLDRAPENKTETASVPSPRMT